MTCSLSLDVCSGPLTIYFSLSLSLSMSTLDVVLLFPRWCRIGFHVVPRSNPQQGRLKRRLQNLHKWHEPTAVNFGLPNGTVSNHMKLYIRVGTRLFLEDDRPHPTAKHNGKGGWRARPHLFQSVLLEREAVCIFKIYDCRSG